MIHYLNLSSSMDLVLDTIDYIFKVFISNIQGNEIISEEKPTYRNMTTSNSNKRTQKVEWYMGDSNIPISFK